MADDKKPALIEPRTLKGFRDFLPAVMIPKEQMLEKARQVFRSYGYAPIDTPALEYTEILMGKGGEESDRLIYRFKDHGDRDVALRFDLTVPFARFAAQYVPKLGTPFKRYHTGPVWRGENTAHGRFREFWQCDFDTIGTTSNAADIETLLVIHDLMVALGFERFTIRVNNRQVLNGVLARLGHGDRTAAVLRALDKFDKIGRAGVKAELLETTPNRAGLKDGEADQVLDIATGFKGMSNRDILASLQAHVGSEGPAWEGWRSLNELLDVASTAGVPESRIQVDPSIARGLDYYTGTIYETNLADKPDIGSVCSGGRYDNLAALYTKQPLPGVGASLGLDRLLAAMEELNMLSATATPAPVIILQFDASKLGEYQKMARTLRAQGIGVEVFPDAKKLGQQFQYAEKRGFHVALIAGSDEFAADSWKVKDLDKRGEKTGKESIVKTVEVAVEVRRLLATS